MTDNRSLGFIMICLAGAIFGIVVEANVYSALLAVVAIVLAISGTVIYTKDVIDLNDN